jgi:hypothetical protein
MDGSQIPSEPEAEPLPERNATALREAETAERRRALFAAMAKASLRLLAGLEEKIDNDPEADLGELSLAHARVTRSIRLSMLLELRLNEERGAKDQARQAGGPGARSEAQAVQDEREGRIDDLRELAEELIQDEADEAEVERCLRLLPERLDREAADPALLERPVGAQMAAIARDLGVEAPNWALWQDEPWAQDEALQLAPGSPYATVQHWRRARKLRAEEDQDDDDAPEWPP